MTTDSDRDPGAGAPVPDRDDLGASIRAAAPAGEPPDTEAPRPVDRAVVTVLLVLMLWAGFGAFFFSGAIGEVLFPGLLAAPIAVLGVLAHRGRQQRWALGFAWVGAALVLAGVAFSLSTLGPVAWRPGSPGAKLGASPTDVLLVCLLGCGVAAAPILIRPLRRRLARFLPLSPDDPVHTLALFATLSLIGMHLVLLALWGEPPYLLDVKAGVASGDGLDPRIAPLVELVWLIPLTAVLAGYGVSRSLAAVRARLGLGAWRWRTLAWGVGLGLVLVPVFWGVDASLAALWRLVGWAPTDQRSVDQLFQAFGAPAGALALAVSAGVGEELLVRGLLQPRLGILLSNLFFAALHAPQYHTDALLSVFLFGLLLGALRRRTDLWVCMWVHGVYDFVAVLWPWLIR